MSGELGFLGGGRGGALPSTFVRSDDRGGSGTSSRTRGGASPPPPPLLRATPTKPRPCSASSPPPPLLRAATPPPPRASRARDVLPTIVRSVPLAGMGGQGPAPQSPPRPSRAEAQQRGRPGAWAGEARSSPGGGLQQWSPTAVRSVPLSPLAPSPPARRAPGVAAPGEGARSPAGRALIDVLSGASLLAGRAGSPVRSGASVRPRAHPWPAWSVLFRELSVTGCLTRGAARRQVSPDHVDALVRLYATGR
jgi:hypothetical protein